MAPIQLNNFNSQHFNNYIFETSICIIYNILIEIIIIFNWYGVTMTQLITFVPLYSCNNIILKTAAIAAETVVRKLWAKYIISMKWIFLALYIRHKKLILHELI